MEIDTVVFDVGRVLIRYEPREFISSMGIGDRERLLNAVFGSEAWQCLDRGIIDDSMAVTIMSRGSEDLRAAIEEIIATWYTYVHPVEGVERIASLLSNKGVRLLYLSNFQRSGALYLRERIPAFSYVNDGLFSYTEGVIKPDERIYRRFFERFSLRPEQCVFIDDTPENVFAGERLGMPGIIFTDAENLETRLHDYGIL